MITARTTENPKPLINEVLTWSDEEINILSAGQISWLAYGIDYFEFQTTPTAREIQVMNMLKERKLALESASSSTNHQHLTREMKYCSCGHFTEHPMNTSTGTACPDCYDWMSD